MNLTLRIKILSKYKGKTKFNFWKDLEPNEILRLELPLETLSRSRNGLSTPYIKITKVYSKESEEWSFNDVCRYLDKIEHEEIINDL